MPAKFDACVKHGGRVRTMKMPEGRFRHICFPQGGGKAQLGHVKTKVTGRKR